MNANNNVLVEETNELTIEDVRQLPGNENIKDAEAIRTLNSLKKICALIYFLHTDTIKDHR